ncbi:MAG: CpsD/CapB family tyrosine-protein kinase [Lachnospiraceae bacterium]|nr:CpsD/CapB family tyrosine-protein kinase [Lachnospiraceae bacterium]
MQEVNLQFDKNEDYRVKEAYKTLRTNVEFCGGDVKVVALTSCTPNEGKSSITMELARSFAEAGNKILLIDADMRKSVLVGRYKTGGVRLGLSHCLVRKYSYEDVACETNVSGLDVIFSGPVPPNPSELLGSGKFMELLGSAKKKYDYIFIDTPPLGSVIDAAVVAKISDGTILVVESNAVSYRFAQRVKDQLDKADSRILGVVLNKVELNSRGYYGHYGRYYGKYYGKYYGRYGEEEGTSDSFKEGGARTFPRDGREDREAKGSRETKEIRNSGEKSADRTTKRTREVFRGEKEDREEDDGMEYIEDI